MISVMCIESALIFVPAATFGQLIPKCDTELVGPALQLEKSESGGGLICWDRKKYVWQQHGD